MANQGIAATDWDIVGVMSVGPRRAKREAAKLNGPKGQGFPRITHREVAPGIRVEVEPVRIGGIVRPLATSHLRNTVNVAAIALPRVAQPLPSIRPHFTTEARTFRSARATPPTGTGVRVVDFLK